MPAGPVMDTSVAALSGSYAGEPGPRSTTTTPIVSLPRCSGAHNTGPSSAADWLSLSVQAGTPEDTTRPSSVPSMGTRPTDAFRESAGQATRATRELPSASQAVALTLSVVDAEMAHNVASSPSRSW